MNKVVSIRRFHLIAIIIICVLSGFIFGTNNVSLSWKDYKPIVSVNAKNPPPGQNLNMTLFYDVLNRINENYYDKSKIKSDKVLYGAIAGALQSLDDPYTSFFPPQANTDFKTQMAGEFSGIGAELGLTEGRVSVTAPLDGSPAEKAGVKNGDFILKVNGDDTTGWTLPQAVDKIRGPRGSQVSLTILHAKDKTPMDLKITRDTIQVKSVTGWLKEVSCDGNSCAEKQNCPTCASIAYIRLSQFGDKTNDEWIAKINELLPKIQAEKNFKGIVFDLRSNPGGYLNDAVFIASEFLTSGVVVKQQDGTGAKIEMNVSRKGLLTEYPVMVLVNGGSASAAEIVSGALRDHGRAKLVGEKSFGKGTVQEAIDLDQGASVHVTIAKWLTPNDTWVHKVGLTPDIEVKYDENSSKDASKFDNQISRAIQELLK